MDIGTRINRLLFENQMKQKDLADALLELDWDVPYSSRVANIVSAPTVDAYKIVLEDLKQVSLFTGKYDAKNWNEHFVWGGLTVLEYIASKAGNEEYSDMFIENMNKSVYRDKAVTE